VRHAPRSQPSKGSLWPRVAWSGRSLHLGRQRRSTCPVPGMRRGCWGRCGGNPGPGGRRRERHGSLPRGPGWCRG
jgi:hypothetical protein